MKKIVLFLFSASLFFLNPNSYAGNEKFNARVSGTSLVQYTHLTVKDDKYDFMDANRTGSNGWKNSFTNHKITNTVTLSVDPYNLSMHYDPYEVEVELEVKYYKWDDVSSQFVMYTVPSNPTLKVAYNVNGTEYKDRVAYQFEGGNRMVVKVVGITRKVNGTTVTETDFPVYLEGEIQVERYYAFNTASAPVLKHSDETSGSGEVEVTWNFLPGAEEYDLEWTYVNNFDENGLPLPQSQVVFEPNVFRFNSTRVSTTSNFYRIPVIYEQGFLLFRVRGVSRSAADGFKKNLYSAWSVNADAITSVLDFPADAKFEIVSGHEKNLNWQYNISYAEEGKSKVVVSYFDGSLRNRQSVTRMNSKPDQVIVGETIYDHQGRPAIQVLPVPFSSPVIEYKPDFNKNGEDKPYSKSDFDYDATCVVEADPLNTNSGASNYYSGDNSISDASSYIPDANGYPFTQTQYTPDNTGRIKAQTGVGETHQLGSGHETKYYYGKPTSQTELDRLFGEEVGDVIHYKKNMVIDPNGQISVSYLDPQGRVIATALAGATPDNVESLGATETEVSADFMNGTGLQQDIIDQSKVYTQEMLVTTAGTREFNYKVAPSTFSDACGTGETEKKICYNCVLDLAIHITDECGQEFLVNLDGVNPSSTYVTIGQAVIDQINGGNYVALDCEENESNPPAPFKRGTASGGDAYTSSSLPVGNYTISKVLTVNQQALDFYTENYIQENECLLTFEEFYDEELSHIDVSGCGITCEECLGNLGDYDQYNETINPDCNPCMSPQEYSDALAKCDNLCNSTSVNCTNAFQMLINDVSPQGQYGLVMNSIGDFVPGNYVLSVFNKNNIHLPKQAFLDGDYHPDWKHPMYKDKSGVIQKGYLQSDGSAALIMVNTLTDGTYSPAVDNNAELINQDGVLYVAPEDLANVNDLIFFWKPSWANSLVMHHPEYMLYEYCVMEEQSHQFDEAWLQLNEASEVPDAYFTPLGTSMNDALDPYFNANVNPNLLQVDYDYMNYSMNHYATLFGGNATIWQAAYAMEHCPYYGNDNCNSVSYCEGVDISTVTPAYAKDYFTDGDWVKFRMFYQSLKQTVYYRQLIHFGTAHSAYNGCIGAKGYRFWNDDFFKTPYYTVTVDLGIFGQYIRYRRGRSQYLNPEQPCSYRSWFYFRDKVRRFDNPKDNPPNSGLSTSTCYNEISDGEYEEINCEEKNSNAIDLSTEKYNFDYYETCGECPITKSLEMLLDGIVKNNTVELNNTFQLSCYPQSQFPEFTEALQEAMNFNSSGTGAISWHSSSGNTDNTLNASIQRSGASSCGLTLKFKDSYPMADYNSGNTVNKDDYNWNDIKSVCCITSIGSDATTITPYEAGKHFLASAVVPFTDSEGETRDEKITIEGKSCINLTDCPVPTICTPTDSSATLENLLNQLMFRAPATTTGAGDEITQTFVTSVDIPLTPQYGIYDEHFLDAIKAMAAVMETSESFKWSGTDNGMGSFTGYLKGYDASNTEAGQCVVYLTADEAFPSGASFDDILSINSITSDKTTDSPGNKFVCYGLVSYMDGITPKKKYIRLKGHMPCATLFKCQVAQKPTVSN